MRWTPRTRTTNREFSSLAAPAIVAVAVASVLLVPVAAFSAEAAADLPRTADGKPDFSGTYDIATLTPLQRPPELGDKLFLTREEAAEIADLERLIMEARSLSSDPEREEPPEGGDGSPGAAGNVGGYNTFWIDRGSGNFEIDGKYRTSIITDPLNGQYPALSEEGKARQARAAGRRRDNTGTAWWLDLEIGPYDDIELRPLGERCIFARRSTGPPSLPGLYNNLKTIVQTDDHVVILVEWMHWARIIRLNAEHAPSSLRSLAGDSVGHWEGDTLVVETTNFIRDPGRSGELRVVERFTRVDKDNLLVQFTVDDASTWSEPWSGEIPWPAANGRLYEYACHEGNYAMGNIMRGARLLEEEALAAKAGKSLPTRR